MSRLCCADDLARQSPRRAEPEIHARMEPTHGLHEVIHLSELESPNIDRLEWGRVHTSVGSFRDAKLWPGGGREWDWNETGTHHSPGVQPEDLLEVLGHGSEVVIIGCGQSQRLGVTQEAENLVTDRGSEILVLESNRAIDRYNELADNGVAVGALIHSTC